ncbi:hypothetical protein NEILACOT_03381 [Neisseria lactamica ATCC 23970]|uniref:Uncharacterized protein n=1 Tax=Neisseria lactamica ATCC 23970 TaxID=546265 RepID=D0W783_NEILA|nr:hypothetical protein NEILACOT_03381 [Neisseria lactamica ATCC 23970]
MPSESVSDGIFLFGRALHRYPVFFELFMRQGSCMEAGVCQRGILI